MTNTGIVTSLFFANFKDTNSNGCVSSNDAEPNLRLAGEPI
jgi:hypothetical protein